MEDSWTILKVLQWTKDFFSRKGLAQPRADAEVLLAHALGVERIQLYLSYDKPLTPDELSRYRELIRRRSAHEPVQYITGRQEFWSLEFEVSAAVLIPRPETEVLVEQALEIFKGAPATALDLCTGSGAIAVSLAHERPDFRIVASDRSHDALIVAERNAIRHGVRDRILFVAADLFDGISTFGASFDFIVCNPPYVGELEFPSLAPEIAEYEPESALRGGGPNGLDLIRRILKDAPVHLKPGGALLLEIGQGQAEVLEMEIGDNSWIDFHRFIKDYSGVFRVLHCRNRK